MEQTLSLQSCVVKLDTLLVNVQKNDLFFGSKNFELVIPEYQRPYVWGIEQAKILLEDLEENWKKNQKYFLGSLILHKEKNKEHFDVVDGQQRLTTLALVLRVLGDQNQQGQEKNFLGNAQFKHNDSKRHIKENYDFIQEWFGDKSDKDKGQFLEYLLENVEFVCILAPSLDEAFIFFDSANSKGKKLEVYDLMKAFHLRLLDQHCHTSLPYYAKQFEEYAKSQGKLSLKVFFEEVLTPLRVWIRGKNILSDKIKIYDEFCKENQKTNDVRSIHDLGVVKGIIGGIDFFDYMIHYMQLYKRIIESDFYQKISEISGTGFGYNRFLYVIAMMAYFDQFESSDEVINLINRVVFSLRIEKSAISRYTIRDEAIKLLPKMFFAGTHFELTQMLRQRKFKKIQAEKNADKTHDAGMVTFLKAVIDDKELKKQWEMLKDYKPKDSAEKKWKDQWDKINNSFKGE